MAPEARLRAGLWVAAYLARLRHEAIPAFVVARGDEGAGAVLVKSATLDGKATLFQRSYDASGDRVWMTLASGTDAEVDDGWLDVVAIGPRNVLQWLDVVGRVVIRHRRDDDRLHSWRARTVVVRAEHPQPAQLDGDPIGEVRELRIEVGEAEEKRVEEVLGDTTVEGVRVRNTATGEEETLAVSGFFVAVGHDPRSGLVRDVVDTDDEACASGHGEAGHLAVAAPDVEDAGRSGELLGGQREDLFLVLGVGAVGEPVDPPFGVPFPQRVVHGVSLAPIGRYRCGHGDGARRNRLRADGSYQSTFARCVWAAA